MNPRRHHTGMTLVEVLATLAILSMFVVLVSAWMTGSVRRHRAMVEVAYSSSVLDRIMLAMAADIAESAPNSVEVEPDMDRLACLTTHRLPGDPEGWNQVTWQWTEDRGLVRQVGTSDEPRVVSVTVDAFDLEWSESEDRATLRVELSQGEKQRARRWRLVR